MNESPLTHIQHMKLQATKISAYEAVQIIQFGSVVKKQELQGATVQFVETHNEGTVVLIQGSGDNFLKLHE